MPMEELASDWARLSHIEAWTENLRGGSTRPMASDPLSPVRCGLHASDSLHSNVDLGDLEDSLSSKVSQQNIEL